MGMCNLGTLKRPQGKQWKNWRVYENMYRVRAGELETLQ